MSSINLVNLLQERALQQPDRLAYTFLEDGKNESVTLTYQQLDRKARAIATYLQSRLPIGAQVLLVYPQGLEVIAAFFGCLYAGVVAIPAPAPETGRLKRGFPRLEAIAFDAGASLILTTANLLANSDLFTFRAESFVNRIKSFVNRINYRVSLPLDYYLLEGKIIRESPHLATLPWIASENIPDSIFAQVRRRKISGDTLAYLQYTSGSTCNPKGVMLDHNNLMGHLETMQQCGGYDSQSVSVTWLPYFHDYGLVEGILFPLYNGTPCYLMSPMAFIKQPLVWLKAINRYRATHSQAPNFAYAYCLKRITPEELTKLDLSSWQAAGNGAEPIIPEVMEQFCQTFELCGFRPQTFAPSYGLAEATLGVSTSQKNNTPVFCTVSAEALRQNRIVETPTGKRLAGAGRLLEKTIVAIVHPEKLTRCAVDEVGEIWVASPGVARGYWQRPDATAETFRACLADTKEKVFLRTGDLGFIKNGELFVTGRLKDLIIIRGQNYYPQDIEWVVEKSHPALRPDYGAAFVIETDGVEQLIVAFEVERTASKNLNVDQVVGAIRNAVAEHFGLTVYGVVLLKRGGILKTTSGKIQRQACRQAFLDDSLDSLAIWNLASVNLTQNTVAQNDVEFQLVQICQKVLGVSSISTKDTFFELGGDSLKAAILVAEIEKVFNQPVSFATLVEAPTICQLANLLCQHNVKERILSIIPINSNGCKKRPFFYIPGLWGYAFHSELARYLDPDRPFYGLQAVGLDGNSPPYTCMDNVVAHYIQEIQTVQPDGPYLLGGQCMGGNIALAIAQELKNRGQQVSLVVLSDSPNSFIEEEQRLKWWNHWILGKEIERERVLMTVGFSQVDNVMKVIEANLQILFNHQPQRYSGQVVYFSAQDNQKYLKDNPELAHLSHVLDHTQLLDQTQSNSWNRWVESGIEIIEVPGNHWTFEREPFVQFFAEKLNACLEGAESAVLSELQ